MKKILVVLLSVMLLCCAGCSSSKSNGSVDNDTEEQTEKVVFEKGNIEDNIYTNKSLNLKFVPTESMVMLTDEEMFERMQQGLELMEGNLDAYKNVDVDDLDIVYEIFFDNISNRSNFQFSAEKLPLLNITPEQYLNAVASQIQQAADFEVSNISEIKDYDLCDIPFKILTIEMGYQGISLKETLLYSTFGDRMLEMTFTYLNDADFDELMGCFSKLQ